MYSNKHYPCYKNDQDKEQRHGNHHPQLRKKAERESRENDFDRDKGKQTFNEVRSNIPQ